MVKKIINAVAGSGKTKYIIDSLNTSDRFLILTFTINNFNNIKNRVLEKYEYFPENIHIFTFFNFLSNFCIKPLNAIKYDGIIFNDHRPHYGKYKMGNKIFSNEMSRYLIQKSNKFYINRIDEFFDKVFVDEIQDFTSYDLDWVLSLEKLNSDVTLVGDFYQHTYGTSSNGKKNKNVFESEENYREKYELKGYKYDNTTFSNSLRCDTKICSFVRENLKINIFSNEDHKGHIYSNDLRLNGIEQLNCNVSEILENNNITKLFFKNSSKYKLNSMNWGDSKGLTFEDVCVILNPTSLRCLKQSQTWSTQSKMKFYVACTRATRNVYLINQSETKDYKID